MCLPVGVMTISEQWVLSAQSSGTVGTVWTGLSAPLSTSMRQTLTEFPCSLEVYKSGR